MRRIALWLASTAVVLVLLFSYRTSTMGAGGSPTRRGRRPPQCPRLVSQATRPPAAASLYFTFTFLHPNFSFPLAIFHLLLSLTPDASPSLSLPPLLLSLYHILTPFPLTLFYYIVISPTTPLIDFSSITLS
jgi:hypothetical protein